MWRYPGHPSPSFKTGESSRRVSCNTVSDFWISVSKLALHHIWTCKSLLAASPCTWGARYIVLLSALSPTACLRTCILCNKLTSTSHPHTRPALFIEIVRGSHQTCVGFRPVANQHAAIMISKWMLYSTLFCAGTELRPRSRSPAPACAQSLEVHVKNDHRDSITLATGKCFSLCADFGPRGHRCAGLIGAKRLSTYDSNIASTLASGISRLD